MGDLVCCSHLCQCVCLTPRPPGLRGSSRFMRLAQVSSGVSTHSRSLSGVRMLPVENWSTGPTGRSVFPAPHRSARAALAESPSRCRAFFLSSAVSTTWRPTRGFRLLISSVTSERATSHRQLGRCAPKMQGGDEGEPDSWLLLGRPSRWYVRVRGTMRSHTDIVMVQERSRTELSCPVSGCDLPEMAHDLSATGRRRAHGIA